ncbi:MAG TPA: IS1182 family transposase [Candidatus Acidoferrales bacterium]|jgi:transposase|nr:IS1182 family transposase [Candidatus Acidoferrales bacterium]
MAKSYRSYLPDQDFLLPPSLREWLPEDHLAYFVSDVVDQLDLSPMHAVYGDEQRGQPPYDPRMMTKLLVYGYCVGVFSARKIQQRLKEDIAFRVLAAGNEPDFRTISDFRKTHLKTLQGFFEEVLKMALEAGAMKLGRVALDGTKIQANASKHKAMSYERMQQQEKAIREQVQELLAQAEAIDAAEDARYGKEQRGDELPAELRRRESRLKRIREAKRALERRARAKAESEGKTADGARPQGKDQYNFTDPESRIMKNAEGFVQAYNAQAVVEPNFQLIVGQAVTQAANDKEQVQPMVEATEQQSGQRPKELLADSGYCSEENLEYLDACGEADKHIEAYVAVNRQKHGEVRSACPRGPLPKGATRVDRMRRKLQTKAGAVIYAARKAIVEGVFGQIKQARGFRRFSLRGLDKVQAEWAFVCLTHNILKLYRICYA